MGEERIIIKRFKHGSVALFGLYFGLILGIILGIAVFVLSYLGKNNLPWIFNAAGVSAGAIAGVLTLVSCIVAFILLCLIFSVIYSLVSKMGGAIHFDLAEAIEKKP